LVAENGKRDTIPKSIQLIAGRTGKSIIKEKTEKEPFGKTVVIIGDVGSKMT
jgi:hypothetical protein